MKAFGFAEDSYIVVRCKAGAETRYHAHLNQTWDQPREVPQPLPVSADHAYHIDALLNVVSIGLGSVT